MVCLSLKSYVVSYCRIPYFLKLPFNLPTLSLLSVFQIGQLSHIPLGSVLLIESGRFQCDLWHVSSYVYEFVLRGFVKIFVYFKTLFDFSLYLCDVFPYRICHLSVSSLVFSKCTEIVN